MKGRKPTPIRLLDNNKNFNVKADIEARKSGEPTGASDSLRPPKELSTEAKKEWRRVVKLYRELDIPIVNDLDITTLTAYCECVARYKEAEIAYQKVPMLIKKEDKIIENPYAAILHREGLNIAKFAELLCLSPVGRARMGCAAAKKEQDNDPLSGMALRGRPDVQ